MPKNKLKTTYINPTNNIEANDVITQLSRYDQDSARRFKRMLEDGVHHPSQVIRLIAKEAIFSLIEIKTSAS